MNEQQLFQLICDARLRDLLQEEDSDLLNEITATNDPQTVQHAVEIIQFLDAQQIKFSAEEIQQRYQNLLHKILF